MATPPKSAAPSGSPHDAMHPAQLAKAALRRLVLEKLEPTPENYERAYQQEAGVPAPRLASDLDGEQLAELIDRIVRGVEQRSRQWTTARKKDSLQRVLGGSRGDAGRLQQRLRQLLSSWESEAPDESGVETAPVPLEAAAADVMRATDARGHVATFADWNRIVSTFDNTVQRALPPEADGRALAEAIAEASRRIQEQGANPLLADELKRLCQRADRVLQHRHHLLDQLGGLCRELTESLSDLAEDDSWAQGQCEAMRVKIDEGLTARGVKSVSELLHVTRARQGHLRLERQRARDALKTLIGRMLSELDELGSQTGRFHQSVGRYADVIEKADTLESLTGVVREMVEESRTVQALVAQTQQRLHDEHTRASGLTQRVNELESELRRLSEEVSTDQLTQIANRRGLIVSFEMERARAERTGRPLSIGLIDIDNFKRLNDDLGHSAGDEALRSLAGLIRNNLRPTDHVARYGGEEFVVLLPETAVEEGEKVLTRLQRTLTGGLFMHKEQQVFVTFSAGVTLHRPEERIEDSLERADRALYEAKHAGKNRTCIG